MLAPETVTKEMDSEEPLTMRLMDRGTYRLELENVHNMTRDRCLESQGCTLRR